MPPPIAASRSSAIEAGRRNRSGASQDVAREAGRVQAYMRGPRQVGRANNHRNWRFADRIAKYHEARADAGSKRHLRLARDR